MFNFGKTEEEKGRLQALETNYAIISFKPDGTIIHANSNFLHTLGYTLDEVAGKHHRMFCNSTYASSFEYTEFWKNLANGISQINEFERFKKDGTSVWIQASYTPVKDNSGKVTRVVKFAQDITDTKKVIKAISDAVDKANAGFMNQTIKESTSNEGVNSLKDLFNKLLVTISTNVATDTNKLQDALQSYQKLDFTHRIPDPHGNVSQGLNGLAEIINEMLVENKVNGLTLDKSSDILLKNVDLLNKNSNESAASLEETAAALEEVTGNISNTTENVVKMAGYAKDVTSASNTGQELANKTTKSMDEIDEQVTAISDAISVIDQIAFQTNILSLNAAVEAATAGEAGKGFAVVAGEVRNLATRSAEAASEIKKLVENATSKAGEGKTIANKMIEGYKGLNESITKTISLIQDVESASKEQQSAIVQINDAVNSLDRQTQENASIASQTHEVAVQTDEIAKLVVSDANEKEFIGKDNVKAKDMKTNTSTPEAKLSSAKKSASKVENKPKTITSNINDDEWASF